MTMRSSFLGRYAYKYPHKIHFNFFLSLCTCLWIFEFPPIFWNLNQGNEIGKDETGRWAEFGP
jgi:hypothetical protein